MMAQVNGLVLLLIVLWWVRRERSPWAGAFLGLAAAIKMSPFLLILVPLSERRFRESLVVAGGRPGGLVLGSCVLIGARGLRFFRDVATGFLPGHAYHGLDVPIDFVGKPPIAALAPRDLRRRGGRRPAPPPSTRRRHDLPGVRRPRPARRDRLRGPDAARRSRGEPRRSSS